MSLLNPLFLLGTLAAAVPVLLHLIRRADADKIEFPSLMFLRRISRRYIRFQKLRHLLLLLMRVLVLLLIAIAFARPYRKTPHASAGLAQAATARIILLDNSMSMAYGDRWSRARDEAADIVRNARPGDMLALLEFSDRTLVRVPLTTDPAAVLNQISAVETTDRATRYGQALRMAERVGLDAATARRTIYLITDFQKSGLVADEQNFRLGSGVELKGVDLGADGFSNLSLTDGLVTFPESGTQGLLRVSGSIVNAGDRERNRTRVTASVDDRVLGEKTVDLARGTVEKVEFTAPAPGAGPHLLVLQVDDPNLIRDNRFSLRLDARGRRPVLTVEELTRSSRSPWVFLNAALNVSSVSPFVLSRVSSRQIESGGIVPGALVIWNDAEASGSGLRTRLEEFVRAGGGMVVVVADAPSGPAFNRLFGTWLPARVEGAGIASEARPRPAEDYRLLTDLRMDHPIFRPFREPHSGGFSNVRFFRHARVSVAQGAEVLARFDNGDPALISVEVGKGRVLLFTSSADDSGNDLPLRAVYAPFWQQLLHFLEKFRDDRLWYQVGDVIDPRTILSEVALDSGRTDFDAAGSVVMLDPARRRVAPGKNSDMVVLDQAGFYDIRSSSLATGVAVNTPPDESDLTHADADEVIAGWASLRPAAAPADADEEPRTPERQDQQQGLWRFLLLTALVLFLGEGFLSNRLAMRQE
jgi:hypothetical protein